MLRDEISRLNYKCNPTERRLEEEFLKKYSLSIQEERREEIHGQDTSELRASNVESR